MKKIYLTIAISLALVAQSCTNGQSKNKTTAATESIIGNQEMSRTDYDALIKKDNIVLVDFYADWCRPCKMMEPSLQEIAKEMKDKVTVIRVDADQNQSLCQDLSIEALPTIMVYKKGTMMWHNVGFVSKEEIVKYLK